MNGKNFFAVQMLCFFVSSILHAGNWSQHQSALNGGRDRIKSREQEIAKLAEEKRGASPEKIQTILVEIQKKQKEIEDTKRSLEKEREHVRFEHPEKGLVFDRVVGDLKVKSVDEIQAEAGLDKKLTSLRSQMGRAYRKPSPTPDPAITSIPTPTPTPKPIRVTPTPKPGPKLKL